MLDLESGGVRGQVRTCRRVSTSEIEGSNPSGRAASLGNRGGPPSGQLGTWAAGPISTAPGNTDAPQRCALFLAPDGSRLTRFAAFRTIRRLAAQAGVREISPHSLRAAFVTLSREAGAPLEDVQDACGHASPVTTRSYDRARYMLERNPTHVLATFIAEKEVAE
jgi:hypothetical protein